MKLLRKLFWSKRKPNYPCVFLCRTKSYDDTHKYDYEVYRLENVRDNTSDGYYLGLLSEDGQEIGDIEIDFPGGEYKLIEY
jgi:hypothetical protein